METSTDAKKKKRIVIAACIVALVVLFFINFRIATTEGHSMEPTIHTGDIFFEKRYFGIMPLSYGDVVAAEPYVGDTTKYCKRVEGLPGDTIDIRGGKLYRNGELVEEGFEDMEYTGDYVYPMTLYEDEYYLLGDNRNNSEDSRIFGPVLKRDIRSVQLFKIGHFDFSIFAFEEPTDD